jgi:uncharacterized membrane protein
MTGILVYALIIGTVLMFGAGWFIGLRRAVNRKPKRKEGL